MAINDMASETPFLILPIYGMLPGAMVGVRETSPFSPPIYGVLAGTASLAPPSPQGAWFPRLLPFPLCPYIAIWGRDLLTHFPSTRRCKRFQLLSRSRFCRLPQHHL